MPVIFLFLTPDKTSKEIFKEQAGDNSLREPGRIEVTFTPRVFPTAARESIAHEEEEVLFPQRPCKG